MNRRQQQAAQTRLDILSAARRLFARDGYRATKIADIAAEAGVSPQTIYDAVGGKAVVLSQIVDGMDAEVGLHDRIPQLAATTDPIELIRWQLDLSRAFLEKCGDILRALGSGTGEPQLREIREEGRRRHRFGAKGIVDRMSELGVLDLSDEELQRRADLLGAFSDAEMFILLIDHYGWTVDEAAAHLLRVLVAAVLDPPVSA